MKKILKNLEPSIRPYLGDAFCFSIINDMAFESGWVYDKYIHTEFTSEDGQIKYADYNYYDFVPGEGVFVKSFTEIPIGCCNQEYICRMIEEMLDEDEYFFALWDEQIITNYLYDEEETGGYEHGCFIYGYDSEEQVFYTQGYLGGDKWKQVQLPYDVFYRALSYFPEKGQIAFSGYRLVEDYEWKFDFERMKEGLSEYQKSLQREDRRILDLRAQQHFFERILMTQQVHYPSLYCLYEHKNIMERRVGFLMERQYVERDEKLCGYARQMKKDYKKLMFQGEFSEPVLFGSYQRMEDAENVWVSRREGRQVKSHELALLLTTSGTTGVSKLVRISKDNLRCNTESICEYLKIDETCRAITVLPFSYTYGLSVLHTHLFAGATLLITKRSVLQKEFWNFFAANEGTSLSGVPFTFDLMEKSGFLKRRYPSLNTMTQAGGKLPVLLQKKYGEYASQHGIKLYLMYGQTEATARMSYLPPQDILRKPGSVGFAIPGGKIQIEKTAQGEGEIVYSGKNVTMGYATCREDLDRGDVNQGVLHTGDIGYQDEEGYLYITGRRAAFAKIYGRRINLKQLEEQVKERWDIYVCCKEHEQKIRVEYETASEEELKSVVEWLSQRTKLGKHCFVPDRRKRRWK